MLVEWKKLHLGHQQFLELLIQVPIQEQYNRQTKALQVCLVLSRSLELKKSMLLFSSSTSVSSGILHENIYENGA